MLRYARQSPFHFCRSICASRWRPGRPAASHGVTFDLFCWRHNAHIVGSANRASLCLVRNKYDSQWKPSDRLNGCRRCGGRAKCHRESAVSSRLQPRNPPAPGGATAHSSHAARHEGIKGLRAPTRRPQVSGSAQSASDLEDPLEHLDDMHRACPAQPLLTTPRRVMSHG